MYFHLNLSKTDLLIKYENKIKINRICAYINTKIRVYFQGYCHVQKNPLDSSSQYRIYSFTAGDPVEYARLEPGQIRKEAALRDRVCVMANLRFISLFFIPSSKFFLIGSKL